MCAMIQISEFNTRIITSLCGMAPVIFVLLLGHVSLTWSCSTHSRWREMSMEETLYKSQVVVIGTDVKHFQVTTTQGLRRTDMIFEVDCILKNTRGGVPRNITVLRVSPRICSGTEVKEKHRYILSIKRTGNFDFEFHEVNTLQSAAHPETEENVQRALRVCGLTQPILPYMNQEDMGGGATIRPPSCPSGISDLQKPSCVRRNLADPRQPLCYMYIIYVMLVLGLS